MSRYLLVCFVLCLGVVDVSAQVAPAAASGAVASGALGGRALPSELDTALSAVKWRSIGPFRGGRSNAGSGVIGDPKTYYMGTTGGGVWKTDNMGISWRNISDGYFTTATIGAIAVAESDPNVVYVGTGEHAVRGVMTHGGDGVYRSTDAGKTWKKIGLDTTQHIARIVVHPKNPDVVYVAAQGALYGPSPERGIFKSTDGGATWKHVLLRGRPDGRRRTLDGRHQPAHHVRRDVGARPAAVEGHQRWSGQRSLQVDRQRRDLGEDDRRACPRRWARWRLPSAARTRTRSTRSSRATRPRTSAACTSRPTPARAGARSPTSPAWSSARGTTSSSSSTRRTRTRSTC